MKRIGRIGLALGLAAGGALGGGKGVEAKAAPDGIGITLE